MSDWDKNKAIGNITEDIVEMLINSMPDWRCVRFGVENHIEELKKNIRTNINSITKKIKCMPDFIALNLKTEETYLLEIKHAYSFINGKYRCRYKRLDEYVEYWEGTKLIIVLPSEPYFVVIDLKKIRRQEMCESVQEADGWWDYWDFKELKQEIKSIFPDLKDESLEDAKKLIP